jgi:acid phosphatase type 7
MKSFLFSPTACIFSICLFAQTVTLTRGPYLQQGTPNSMIIRWKTNSLAVGVVKYSTDINNLSQSAVGTSSTTEHEIKISGLQPATKYFYAVYSNNNLLTALGDSSYYFITSPTPGTEQPVHVWVIGDFGRNNAEQKGVRDSYWNGMKNGRHTDVWLWTGDNAYGDGTDSEYQSNVFNVYPEIFRNTVAWPCPGNHDYKSVSITTHDGPYYRIFSLPKNGEAGGLPSGEEGFYSFDYGNVHFVSINSEWALWTFNNNNAQTQWLHDDLSSTDKKWIIAYWHKPPYSKGSHDSDNTGDMAVMRTNINPILEQYGVDLVLNGHSHNYERSVLIKGHTGTSTTFDPGQHVVDASCGNPSNGEQYVKYFDGDSANLGTIYCVVGNSGSGTSGKSLDHPVFCNAFQNEYGSLTIDVNGNELHAKYFTKEGVVNDEFKIVKQSRLSKIDEIASVKYFLVYPNPVKDDLQIELRFTKEENVTITITDMNGKVVATLAENKKLTGNQYFTWKPGSIAKGEYFVKLSNGKNEMVKKIIIQ